jgi:RNA polymerase sigma-70 factor (ECF subfamily)
MESRGRRVAGSRGLGAVNWNSSRIPAILAWDVRYMDDDWRGQPGNSGEVPANLEAMKESSPIVEGQLAAPVESRSESAAERPMDRPSPSDEALLLGMRSGQTSSGEELVRRYYAPLIRYLQRLTGSSSLAEEMHQQTWLSVLEHLDKFDASGKSGAASGFKSWLFRIATNKANDHWRSAGREKAAKEGLRLVTDGELPAADHRMESTEQERKLQAAIQQLPENQRQVLLLRYYSNLKFIEIAELVGCPLNTALGRMHKAMIRLKELMV